jgi:hypothetical protein
LAGESLVGAATLGFGAAKVAMNRFGAVGASGSNVAAVGRSSEVGAKSQLQVNEVSIRQALEGSEIRTTQGGISIPKVERFVRRLEAGDVPPPIKVDKGIIVEGNHRYVAGRLFGREPAIEPGVMSRSQSEKIRSIRSVRLSAGDWGE